MAPEQAAGLQVDARADVYSAGVVLAEMVSPEGLGSLDSRRSVWEGIRHEPARVPESPWAPVLKRAVAKEPDQRYRSAHTLTRALEDVTLRVEGAEDLTPYPGLASFTEEDAEYFFGREAEVEAMWAKLERPHLMALIGPSGAGKSSFLRAGLVAAKPPGWAHVICSPENAPLASLRRAVISELEGDTEALRELAVGDEDATVSALSRWRKRHAHALVIVDQFEELFTLNSPEEQERFAALLGRLALEADAHVLLSMRDDFFFHCHRFPALAPLQDGLTMLGPPVGAALRRALVQPAMTCGYRFEDDGLVDEMLAEVEGERGALPMLAFAAARLWEQRDRETGVLLRQAYHDIGGVGGALARHAEGTLEKLGAERLPTVRELFRNLVTAEGTRAVRDVDELLSVFEESQREQAAEVVRSLIDARLLTSYESQVEGEDPQRRVEIIHESLLETWPRLVGWRTQDADSARLRDELRQAARTWDEHDRSDDLLWTGSAYREFASWRERYPGGLTDTEEAFGKAMTRHAERRRRRRRTAVAAAFAVLLGVLAVIGGFWRRSVTEARRAEAANLFSLAQLQLEDHPSATVAYAIASLERADSVEMRRLALEALWRGPTEFRLPTGSRFSVEFSPDGHWLLTAETSPREETRLLLWPSDGGPPKVLEPRVTHGEGRISPNGDLIAIYLEGMQELGLWSLPSGRFLRSLPVGGDFNQPFWFSRDGRRLTTSTETLKGDFTEVTIRSWPLPGGEPKLLAQLEVPAATAGTFFGVDPAESLLAWVDFKRFNLAPLTRPNTGSPPPVSLVHEHDVTTAVFDDDGRLLATSDLSGEIKVWSMRSDPPELARTVAAGRPQNWCSIRFDRSGTVLGIAGGGGDLVDLAAPPDAEPLRLKRPGAYGYGQAFEPNGRWFAIGHPDSVSLWPLARPYPMTIRGPDRQPSSFQFTPDGNWLASISNEGTVRVWPLRSGSERGSRILLQAEGAWEGAQLLRAAPDGSYLVAGNYSGRVWILPVGGGPSRKLLGFSDIITSVAVDSRSRLVAAGAGHDLPQEALVRVWDLESESVRILNAGDGNAVYGLWFTSEGDLWVESGPRLRRWDLDADQPRVVEEFDLSSPESASDFLCDVDPDGRQVLLRGPDSLWIQDLDTHEARELRSHNSPRWCSLHADGEIVVSTDATGAIRVGPATGNEPHLLMGRKGGSVGMSADGRWIASRGADDTIVLWPMPDLTKPPLHTLPRAELIAKLESLTNLRVVPDPDSTGGWKVEVGPFPGWKTVPTW
jgi:WD40 repeat protein